MSRKTEIHCLDLDMEVENFTDCGELIIESVKVGGQNIYDLLSDSQMDEIYSKLHDVLTEEVNYRE